MSQEKNFGGWSDFTSQISEQEKIAFKEAVHLIGVVYTPFAAQQQLVAGMNYVFLCNGVSMTLPSYHGLYALHIYKPLSGPAHLTKIAPITAY